MPREVAIYTCHSYEVNQGLSRASEYIKSRLLCSSTKKLSYLYAMRSLGLYNAISTSMYSQWHLINDPLPLILHLFYSASEH